MLLGHWHGTFRGRTDQWSIWYGHDVPWAATGDVQTVPHAVRLIDGFAQAANRAERERRVTRPSPPPKHESVPAWARWAATTPSSRVPRSGGGFGAGFVDGLASFSGVRR